ncbi:MAG: zinc ribbon domain-containing protein [Planctomycetes bacterium]|nr:zinc ribbon domain-containing protein [Planctomycetota bacterium]
MSRRAPALLLVLLLAGVTRASDPEAEALRALAAGDGVAARRAVARLGGLAPGSPEAEAAARRAATLLLAIDAADALAREDARALGALLERAERLAARCVPADLPLLRAVERSLGEARLVVGPLLQAAYRAIDARRPRAELLALAEDDDPRARDLAVGALAERLAALRARVLAGGSLDAAEQADVADPALVRLLIERLAERPGGGATDRLPADAAAVGAGTSTALHALASIEAAALPALEEAARAGRPGAEEALAAAHAAVAQRLRRHPGSTWCSATGAPPITAATAPCPAPCARDVPTSAQFCPACGARVRVVCTTCGALTSAARAHCTSCGARAGDEAVTPCARCRASLPRGARACTRCGAQQPRR